MRHLSMKVLIVISTVLTIICITLSDTRAATKEFDPANLKGNNFWKEIGKNIEESEYEITHHSPPGKEGSGAVYQAPNRKNNLRIFFTNDGILIEPRKAGKERWRLVLRLVGSGCLKDPGIKDINVSGNYIAFDRNGIIEWYRNSREGIEQGFLVEKPPFCKDIIKDRLELSFSSEGNISRRKITPEKIEFIHENGTPILTLSNLMAFDARGKELKAEFSEGSSGYKIVIDTSDAEYPILIDPILTGSYDTMLESDQASAYFGAGISGADLNGDGYGDLVVGAYLYDNGETDEGAVFIYYGSDTGISTTPDLILESNQAGANFGTSITSGGDLNGDGYADLAVGANLYDNDQTDDGAVFVYYGSATGISTTPSVVLDSNQTGSGFGISLSSGGDLNGDGNADLVSGAPYYSNGESYEGGVFVYYGSGTGLSATPDLILESGQTDARMGLSVTTNGDLNGDGYSDLVAGAPYYDNGENNEGRTFIYYGSSSGISSTPDLTMEINQPNARFGRRASVPGDLNGDGYADLAVGAPYYDNGETNEGGVFIFYGASTGISTSADEVLESDQAGAAMEILGVIGDLNGDGYSDLATGSYLYDNPETDEGVVFLFYGSSKGLPTTADLTIEGNQSGAYLGYSVSGTGDLNGDGYDDLVTGAYYYQNGEAYEGAVFVMYGSSSGIPSTPDLTIESNQASAYLGWSVTGAGDLNGDGYADLAAGAPYYDNGENDEGVVYVFYGSSSGISSTPDLILESDMALAHLGYSMSGAGDLNGDGYSDLAVGVDLYDDGERNEGAVFIYYGSPSGIQSSPDLILESNQASAYLGRSVSGIGDLNGDGYADLAAGAPGYDNGETGEGAVFVYYGSSSGVQSSPDLTLESNQVSASLGSSVTGAGDLNGDGYADLAAGAYGYEHGGTTTGAAFIYYGSGSGVGSSPDVTIVPGNTDSWFGYSIAGTGDLNGDGSGDLVVGAPYYTNGQTEEGAVFVYYSNGMGRPFLTRQVRGGGDSTPVQNWGYSSSPDSFTVSMLAKSFRGRERAKLEVEACPSGIPFGDVSCITDRSGTWVDTTASSTGTEITFTLSGLGSNTLYNWRARLLYARYGVGNTGITEPVAPAHGPWRRMHTGREEGNIRASVRHTLSISVSGAGTITSFPSGIDCGTTCSSSFGAPVSVTLTATESSGSTFNSWGGDCSACGTSTICDLTITTDKSCTATFDAVIAVISPNGGETIASGGNHTIQWSPPSGAVSFDLEYSINDGGTWRTIATGVTGTSYAWSVPTVAGNKRKCRVRITAYDSGNNQIGQDTSDDRFMIEVIKVTAPNGGETWSRGTTNTITWTTNATKTPITKVVIKYHEVGVTGWSLIDVIKGSNPGSYDWTIPTGLNPGSYKIKINLWDSSKNRRGADKSDAAFTIN